MTTPEDLRATALSSLTAGGFSDVTTTADEAFVIATVPASRSSWADFALASHTTLRLADNADRARYAIFPTPDDATSYHRTVHFRATGPGLAQQDSGQVLCHTVRIVPGLTTEADIPRALATALFNDSSRAGDISVTRLA
ncbi:hypothetical protein ACFV1U_35915 [Streptomyces microflavus]|uniref:hypothetical protein n=1 Tax=Streptomyces microflavus TaxID=1919 RepID=UPI00367928B3